VQLPHTFSIGPYVVIDEGVHLGEGVVIGAGCIISAFASLGAQTELKPRVVIYHRVQIGARCLIHSGAVIGSDGFGLANENGFWLKIPQLGSVELHDDVEIGANTTIDRGAIENTIIGRGVKIDNQVQIAHNVIVGEGTAMAAQVGIAGSSKIGRHCLLAGKVGINGHIDLADRVIVTAMSGVSSNIDEAGIYSASLPAKPISEWSKTLARINRLDRLMLKVKEIAAKLRSTDE
jgi:UDP-3-O-[3-hydroxymyristoyl] glucosamine N-acyltransferase